MLYLQAKELNQQRVSLLIFCQPPLSSVYNGLVVYVKNYLTPPQGVRVKKDAFYDRGAPLFFKFYSSIWELKTSPEK